MRGLAELPYYLSCLGLGRLLGGARYSTVRLVRIERRIQVRKYRSFYAPLLLRLGDPLVRILDTGVRVLRRREWQQRERHVYRALYGSAVDTARDGALVLPHLPGTTLANLLQDATLHGSVRRRAIELAVRALADFHRQGFTHGDAMADNVMIDLDAGLGRWFDFETVHEPDRDLAWRRADDLRALLATCLVRTSSAELAGTFDLILDTWDDDEVIPLVADGFASVLRRPLAFHLGQAPLTFRTWRRVERLLEERTRPPGSCPAAGFTVPR